MLKGNRLLCLTLLPIFMTPSTITPFHKSAMQITEKQVDNNEMVQMQDYRLKKLQEQYQKDKTESDKIKAEEKTKRQKELEEQTKAEPQWQTFELTFYSGLACENSPKGAITCTGGKLYDGIVASNYYKLGTKIQLQGFGEVTVGDKGSDKYFNNDYRLDVYVPREHGESDSHYYNRVNKMGRIKVKGIIFK